MLASRSIRLALGTAGRAAALAVLAVAAAFAAPAQAQTCPQLDYTFSSQAQIDAFPALGCTEVTGFVEVMEATASDIVNLDGFATLESVGGSLTIQDNAQLASLDGLGAVTTLGGDLVIQGNALLPSLDGIGPITSIGDDLIVRANPLLTSLDGIGTVTSIGDDVTIRNNAMLASLDALGAVTSIGGDLSIRVNPMLASLDGLGAVTAVGGDLTVQGNPALASCAAGLGGLIAGDPPVFVGIGLLLTIESNATGCNSEQEVLDAVEPPSSALVVAINPIGNPDVAHYGGLVFFTAHVTNTGDDPFDGHFWLTLEKPDGTSGVSFWTHLRLAPGRSAAGLFVTLVRRSAASGTYTYTALAGDYPDAEASASFSFTKHEAGGRLASAEAEASILRAMADAEARTGGPAVEAVATRLDGGADPAAVWGETNDAAWAAVMAGTAPEALALGAPFPNPAASQTTVRYEVAEAGEVRMAVYDAVGREVAVLAEGTRTPGAYQATLDTSVLPTGVYMVRLLAGSSVQSRRLTVVR